MTTTPTREGFIVPVEFHHWDREDWAAGYSASPYALSVIDAANDFGHLSLEDTSRVLRDHSVSPIAYVNELDEAAAAGLVCLPVCHAGQLLTWLGW